MAALSLSCCTKDLCSLLQYVKSFNCNIWDPVLWPGIEPGPPALKSWSLSRWTTKEVPPRPCCSFCGQASSQLPAVIHAYALLGENLLQPLCHLLDFAKMSLCAGVSPPPQAEAGAPQTPRSLRHAWCNCSFPKLCTGSVSGFLTTVCQ